MKLVLCFLTNNYWDYKILNPQKSFKTIRIIVNNNVVGASFNFKITIENWDWTMSLHNARHTTIRRRTDNSNDDLDLWQKQWCQFSPVELLLKTRIWIDCQDYWACSGKIEHIRWCFWYNIIWKLNRCWGWRLWSI